MFYFENKILKLERFYKVSYLSKDKITFLFKNFNIEVIGKELSLISYYEEEAFVSGNIERIIFNYDKLI